MRKKKKKNPRAEYRTECSAFAPDHNLIYYIIFFAIGARIGNNKRLGFVRVLTEKKKKKLLFLAFVEHVPEAAKYSTEIDFENTTKKISIINNMKNKRVFFEDFRNLYRRKMFYAIIDNRYRSLSSSNRQQ